jgi:asparagine synthase (glutamine-hydrolysing)
VCGIAGIVAADRAEIDPLWPAAMIATLDHRGPDDRGFHLEPGVALAHARLSIIDVAGGRQPMSTVDRAFWITFNGEIFNYVELREALARKGHRFRTQSDTEVLLHLYRERGADAVAALNGQWAAGIWDARARVLFLSRDRLGVRPLYYAVVGSRLLFASEMKALFAVPTVSRDLDPKGLDNVFTFWTTLPPRTIFKNIRELPPGHSLTWRDGEISVWPHWTPRFPDASHAARTHRETAALEEELLQRLEQATRLRLRADVPVGAYVSGGLDSAVVAALASHVNGVPPRTFSIAFDAADFDESAHQRQVARTLGTEHHELRCSNEDIARAFPDVVWHAETPVLRTAPAPLYLLARMVRDQGFKVVLTGEGADETLGGYDIFREAKIRRFWSRFPSSSRRASLIRRLYPWLRDLHRQPAAYLQAFFHVGPGDLVHPAFSHLPRWNLTSRLKLFFSDQVAASLTGYDGVQELVDSLPRSYGGWDPLCQAQYLEMAHLLPGYILSSQGDRMAMAHGVESRYPFLDPDVVAFGSTLDPTLKVKGLAEKYLLKRAARRLVPESIVKRAKQPYRAPGAHAFLTGRTAEYAADLLSAAQVRRDGVFEPAAVEHLVRKVRSGRALGVKDDMAFVGVLSTQIVIDRFVNHFITDTHGILSSGTSSLHHR